MTALTLHTRRLVGDIDTPHPPRWQARLEDEGGAVRYQSRQWDFEQDAIDEVYRQQADPGSISDDLRIHD